MGAEWAWVAGVTVAVLACLVAWLGRVMR